MVSHGTLKLLFYGLIIGLIGCTAPSAKPPVQLPPGGLHILAIMPMENMTAIHGEGASIRDPLSAKVYTTRAVAPRAEEVLTKHLHQALVQQGNFTIIPPGSALGARAKVLERLPAEISARRLIVEIGLSLRADAVVLGHLYRFEERIGESYSVEKPASVRFDLQLVEIPSGRLIWWDDFDETQQPLTENLFSLGTFLKRKGRWITATQMAQGAIDQLMLDFPNPDIQ